MIFYVQIENLRRRITMMHQEGARMISFEKLYDDDYLASERLSVFTSHPNIEHFAISRPLGIYRRTPKTIPAYVVKTEPNMTPQINKVESGMDHILNREVKIEDGKKIEVLLKEDVENLVVIDEEKVEKEKVIDEEEVKERGEPEKIENKEKVEDSTIASKIEDEETESDVIIDEENDVEKGKEIEEEGKIEEKKEIEGKYEVEDSTSVKIKIEDEDRKRAVLQSYKQRRMREIAELQKMKKCQARPSKKKKKKRKRKQKQTRQSTAVISSSESDAEEFIASDSDIAEEDQVEWKDVDKILKHRVCRDQTQYKVRYTDGETEWRIWYQIGQEILFEYNGHVEKIKNFKKRRGEGYFYSVLWKLHKEPRWEPYEMLTSTNEFKSIYGDLVPHATGRPK